MGPRTLCVRIDPELIGCASPEIDELQRTLGADLRGHQPFERGLGEVPAGFVLETIAHDRLGKGCRKGVRCIEHAKRLGWTRESARSESRIGRRRTMLRQINTSPVD